MLRALAPYLAYAYLTFVKWTTRLRWRDRSIPEALRRKKQGYIFAFWHNRQVFFTTTHGRQGFHVMVSLSRDGEIIAKVMDLSGIGAVRGSSSRGSSTALREMIAIRKRGEGMGISPDGPKGPVYEVKPGVLYLAQKLKIPIVPITNALTNKLVLKRSWDQFQVPLPFGRGVVGHGEPIWIAESDDLEAKAREVKEALDRITRAAEKELGL